MRKEVICRVMLRLLFVIFVSGCSLYKNPVVESFKIPATFRNANKFIDTKLKDNWWQNFDDAKLNQLVQLAIKNNFDYQIALKNIQIARTYVKENRSSLFPQVNLNAGGGRNATSVNALTTKDVGITSPLYNLYQLNGTVSYEVDVWNRVGNSIKQAEINVKVSEAEADLIKLAIISSVVDIYWQIVVLNSNLNNLAQQYSVVNEIVRLNQDQYKGGLVNIEPIADAETQVENIKNNLNGLKKQRQVLQGTLAHLVGAYPESFDFKISRTLQNLAIDFTKIVPAGISSKILINRPDMQQSFYQVVLAGYAQKQSLAAFFPTFALTGTYGFASLGLANFTAGNSLLWNFGANLVQPLFDYAKRISQHRRAQLHYESAVLSYKNSVINAFKEVNNALVAYQRDYLIWKAMQRITSLGQEKLGVANAQYQAGVVDYVTYLGYKLAFLQSRYMATSQTQVLVSDVIQVYKVLGLGVEFKS